MVAGWEPMTPLGPFTATSLTDLALAMKDLAHALGVAARRIWNAISTRLPRFVRGVDLDAMLTAFTDRPYLSHVLCAPVCLRAQSQAPVIVHRDIKPSNIFLARTSRATRTPGPRPIRRRQRAAARAAKLRIL